MNTRTAKTLAELFDLLERRIQQLAAEGIIPRTKTGQYDFLGAVRGYVGYLRKRGLDPDPVEADLYAQRARLTKEQADKAEMDNRKTKSELVPVTEAAKLLEKVVLALRSRILALPIKAAPHVHGCRSIAETKDALELSLHDALNELAQLDVAMLGSR